jgi:hypothetical protein
MSSHIDTVRAFWDACERREYEACRPLIGDGYIAIDHTLGFVATTPEELRAAQVEDAAWSDWKYAIDRASETTDGALVVQATFTATLTGEWRSVKGTGQFVRREVCDIFRFDADGRIVVEEIYEDALSIMRQLGAVSV